MAIMAQTVSQIVIGPTDVFAQSVSASGFIAIKIMCRVRGRDGCRVRERTGLGLTGWWRGMAAAQDQQQRQNSSPRVAHGLTIPRVLAGEGFDYWESGMDLHLGEDMYDSFVHYQRWLLSEFDKMVDEYGFEVIDAACAVAPGRDATSDGECCARIQSHAKVVLCIFGEFFASTRGVWTSPAPSKPTYCKSTGITGNGSLLRSMAPDAMYPPPAHVIIPAFGTRTICKAKNADG